MIWWYDQLNNHLLSIIIRLKIDDDNDEDNDDDNNNVKILM